MASLAGRDSLTTLFRTVRLYPLFQAFREIWVGKFSSRLYGSCTCFESFRLSAILNISTQSAKELAYHHSTFLSRLLQLLPSRLCLFCKDVVSKAQCFGSWQIAALLHPWLLLGRRYLSESLKHLLASPSDITNALSAVWSSARISTCVQFYNLHFKKLFQSSVPVTLTVVLPTQHFCFLLLVCLFITSFVVHFSHLRQIAQNETIQLTGWGIQ